MAWHFNQWAVCVLGEIGEAANALKKKWRGDGTADSVIDELCDVVIYCDLACARTDVARSLEPFSTSQDDISGTDIRVDGMHVDVLLIECASFVGAVYSGSSSGRIEAINRIVLYSIAAMKLLGCEDVGAAIVKKFNDTSDKRGCSVYIDEDTHTPIRFHDTCVGTSLEPELQARRIVALDMDTAMWVEDPSPVWSVGGGLRDHIIKRMNEQRRMGMRKVGLRNG